MKNTFSKLLAASGLVKLDSQEPGENAAPDFPVENAEAAAFVPLPAVLAPEESVVAEQKDFSTIYAEAGVPPSPYTAEKLLKLLGGLQSMPQDVRIQAVKAMDAADDSWSVDDAVVDAERKIKALGEAKALIAQQVASAVRNADDEVASIQAEEQSSSVQVRKQIADLTALLDRGTARAAQQIAEVRSGVKTNQEAGERESARLDSEIQRLGTVTTFAGVASAQIKE